MRLDAWLVAKGHFSSRARAQAAIRAGLVLVNGRVVTRPAASVGDGGMVEVRGDPIGFVGRGGLKLEAALRHFDVKVQDRVCLDVGASTGGFTDCLLRAGARLVYAVDVGTGQLHPRLRGDHRVVSLEGTDIRELATLPPEWPAAPTMAVVDVSFIGLAHVLPPVRALLGPEGEGLVLVKPQFEVGPGGVGKGGLVKDEQARRRAVRQVMEAAREGGWTVRGVFPSPVPGKDGNQEYFLSLARR